jgi:hypothetical protein
LICAPLQGVSPKPLRICLRFWDRLTRPAPINRGNAAFTLHPVRASMPKAEGFGPRELLSRSFDRNGACWGGSGGQYPINRSGLGLCPSGTKASRRPPYVSLNDSASASLAAHRCLIRSGAMTRCRWRGVSWQIAGIEIANRLRSSFLHGRCGQPRRLRLDAVLPNSPSAC